MRSFLPTVLILLLSPVKAFSLYYLLGTTPLISNTVGGPEGLWTCNDLSPLSLRMAFFNREWHITYRSNSQEYDAYQVDRLFT